MPKTILRLSSNASALAKSGLSVLVAFSLLFTGCKWDETTITPDAAAPQRVVSLVPAVTETLFALGLGDRVVGVSDFDNYPTEAIGLPHVGALINPNIEKIFQLRPDMVFVYGTQSLLQERLAAAGIEQYSVISGNIDQVLQTIRGVSRAMGVPEEGDHLSSHIRESLNQLHSGAGKDRPRVLLAHSREAGRLGGFYTGGSKSYLNELIEIGGGENIFRDVDENVFQPTLEEILDRAPEVIIELLPTDRKGSSQIVQRTADWKRLESVPAAKNGRVYVLAGDHLLLVGPRLHVAADEIARAIRGNNQTTRPQGE